MAAQESPVAVEAPTSVLGEHPVAVETPTLVLGEPPVAVEAPTSVLGKPRVVVEAPISVLREPPVTLEAPTPVLREPPVAVETPTLVPGEPMDFMTALQLVIKKSGAHDGLVKGLSRAAKAIEKHAAQLCVLAEDIDQQLAYVKLVKALCSKHNVHLITVPSAKILGEWAEVS